MTRSESTDRKRRADALRNRERILDLVKREFTRAGANASLEEIAKKAGVGPGTLYRHFQTREDLLIAVYRSEMETLAVAERNLATTKSPPEALRAWLLLWIDALETKHIIAPVLNTLAGDPKKVFETSYAQVYEALRALVKRAVESGDIREDLDPIDFLRAIVGIANVSAGPDWPKSARRLVDILIAGARPLK
ncbi:transcriptional regulator, TetR family [Chthonomonas calidirosea]|uniref:Transcriptional regulator, TetR family n=1 Tax=Chthonomonas calidirosea (strain DSM 23976 / ICMP 18418 / T49) TaxID=1303518 RepID=S0EYT9_CHTCT|nr:TetR/AcrR family transcriptional regulator [Chthonomonas calidirosea]CCW35691.1 transcriptional regulator, TetR family [Chthonomonas calidirosea T49]CEK19522.1 transcriptional regulator, TetR family [Chthonomonas calidirosea]